MKEVIRINQMAPGKRPPAGLPTIGTDTNGGMGESPMSMGTFTGDGPDGVPQPENPTGIIPTKEGGVIGDEHEFVVKAPIVTDLGGPEAVNAVLQQARLAKMKAAGAPSRERGGSTALQYDPYGNEIIGGKTAGTNLDESGVQINKNGGTGEIGALGGVSGHAGAAPVQSDKYGDNAGGGASSATSDQIAAAGAAGQAQLDITPAPQTPEQKAASLAAARARSGMPPAVPPATTKAPPLISDLNVADRLHQGSPGPDEFTGHRK